ncbi:Ran-specific GTPase-activating protein 1 [Tolypocladium ophioglossoides CBS 100239]|uniref:Ran-specific GTPase-activating protein 1 n=1 Tax=Tolypocladium ophioglossoides (strain CBS 100239) TaxID=1163406 RepID=A0A0L0N1Q6_TOLOC|nr:Ran-specific GTPase-activating protein 1 [Tolypocladium ophioglossoides CBS 100239]
MPEGSLRIVLDAPKRVHHPADQVSGKVVFGGEKGHDVGQVRIDFRGIAEVKLPGSLTGQRSRTLTTLFHSQSVVSASRGKLDNPAPYEWPFTFSFPFTAQPSAQWRPNPLFASVSGSLLPPSFTYSSPAFDCKVEYSLEATVVKNHYSSVADQHSHKSYLLFEPVASGARSDPPLASFTRNFTTSGRPLDPRPDRQSQSFGGRLSSYISRRRTDAVPFTVDVKVPSVVVQRERLPCHVSVRADGSNKVPSPKLEIRGLSMAILSHTYVRSGSDKEAIRHTHNIQMVAHQNLDIPFRVDEDVDLSTILSDLHAPVLPPCFTTYNITRRYEMKMVLSVACAEDQFQFIGEVPSLKVVPAAAEAPLFSAEDVPPSYDMTVASQPGPTIVPPYKAGEAQARSSRAMSAGPGPEFKMKARLFEFVQAKTEWKERCHGSLYLQSEEAGKTRLLVCQNGTDRVFANHYITAEMRLIPVISSDRSWTWHSAADLSGETSVALHFAARFKDSESANLFKTAFLKAQTQLGGASAHAGAAHVKSKA